MDRAKRMMFCVLPAFLAHSAYGAGATDESLLVDNRSPELEGARATFVFRDDGTVSLSYQSSHIGPIRYGAGLYEAREDALSFGGLVEIEGPVVATAFFADEEVFVSGAMVHDGPGSGIVAT